MGELERRLAAALDPRKPGEGEPEDEAAPALPSEADEAAFLAGESEGVRPPVVKSEGPDFTTGGLTPLAMPPLDDLVARIPPDVRAALDELFRPRFTGVKRAPEKDPGAHTS